MSAVPSTRGDIQPNQKTSASPSAASIGASQAIRLWPAILIVAFFWVFYFSADYVEMTMFFRFISRFGMYGIVILTFLIWWMAFSRVPW